MGIVGAIALVLFAITAVLIITIVLLQDEQGEGFGGLFGGGGSTTPFGAAGGNVLIRITSILGVFSWFHPSPLPWRTSQEKRTMSSGKHGALRNQVQTGSWSSRWKMRIKTKEKFCKLQLFIIRPTPQGYLTT